MLERQFQTRRGGLRVVYPECQVLQYLVPCFVASALDLYKDSSVPHDKKKEYFQFVHELIESYETREFYQEVETKLVRWKPLKVPFAFCTGWSIIHMEKLGHHSKNVAAKLSNILAESRVKENLYNENSTLFTCIDGDEVPDSFPEACCFQLLMLFSRLNGCSDVKEFPIKLWFKLFVACMTDDDYSNSIELLRKFKDVIVSYSNPEKEGLSSLQVIGILAWSFISTLKMDKFKEKMSSSQGPGFPLDDIDSAMWALYSGDMWTVKQKMSSMAHKSGQDDQTLASVEFARSNDFYEEELKSGLTEEGKVKMSRPGEITFFPVKHCRWCGLLEVDTFRKCSVCVDNPDFPDVHYFCSLKCETEALDQQHTEEHATFLMMRCGIGSK